MKRYALLLVLLYVTPVWAETWYVSKSGDNTSGKSWTAAFTDDDRIDGIGTDSIDVGDTVLWGTGSWYDVKIVPPRYGTNSTWTTYACSSWVEADPLGGAKLCTLWAGIPVASQGADTTNAWIQHSGYIYKAAFTPNECVAAGYSSLINEAFAFTEGDSQLVPRLSLAGITGSGMAWHNTSNDTMYMRSYYDVDPDTKHVVASCKPAFAIADLVDDVGFVRVWGIDIRCGKPGAVYVGTRATDSIFIEHCNLTFAGFTTGENASPFLQLSSSTQDANHVGTVIRACSLGWAMCANDDDGSAPDVGRQHGGGASFYDAQYNVVESCYVWAWTRMGLFFKNDGYDCETEPYVGNVLRYNFVDARHIMMSLLSIGTNPYKCSVYANIVAGGSNYQEEGAMQMNDGSHCTSVSDKECFFGNNTIVDFMVGFHDGDVEECGTALGNDVKYNALYDPRSGTAYDYISFLYSHSGCEDSYEIDSNIYYDPGSNNGWRTFTTRYTTIASWRSATTFDDNSNIVDPGFDSVAAVYTNPWAALKRSGASQEFNPAIEYGGRSWYNYGAVQNDYSGENQCPQITQNLPTNTDTIETYSTNIDMDLYDTDGEELDVVLIGERGDANPTDTLADTTLTADDDWVWNWGSLTEDSTYYWKAIAVDTADCADTSAIWHFHVDSIPAVEASTITIQGVTLQGVKINQ